MRFVAELLLVEDTLYVGDRVRASELVKAGRFATLCETAVEACERGELVPVPAGAVVVGVVDVQGGEVRVHRGSHDRVQSAWGARLDRRELRGVADDREQSETRDFRRAVMQGDAATVARLGPRRGYRW